MDKIIKGKIIYLNDETFVAETSEGIKTFHKDSIEECIELYIGQEFQWITFIDEETIHSCFSFIEGESCFKQSTESLLCILER